MAENIEAPPQSELTPDTINISSQWDTWFTLLYEFLRSYISSSGIQLPRLTTTQISAITNPPNGLMVFNTTTSEPQIAISGAFVNILHA